MRLLSPLYIFASLLTYERRVGHMIRNNAGIAAPLPVLLLRRGMLTVNVNESQELGLVLSGRPPYR